jgi:hypothetical protein
MDELTSLLFQRVSTKKYIKITCLTVAILSHKAQNPLTATDHRTMTTAITAHTFVNIITKAQNPITTANDDQPMNRTILLITRIAYSSVVQTFVTRGPICIA